MANNLVVLQARQPVEEGTLARVADVHHEDALELAVGEELPVHRLGVEAAQVKEDAKFIDDLGADSLDTVELVMAFEEEFSIEIPDDAAEKIQTVGDAINFINSNAKS